MNLLLALTAHGYGHLSQVAPVINAFCKTYPDTRLIVQGDFPEALIATRIDVPFELERSALDVGCAMFGPTEIDWQTTRRWYHDFHQEWDMRLAAQMALLQQRQIDLVVADVPYLPIAAAKAMNIPVAAFSSLNWADALAENPEIVEQLSSELAMMRAVYRAVDAFILPEPAIPTKWIESRRPVAPCGSAPTMRAAELREALKIPAGEKVVLVSLGGIPLEKRLLDFPQMPGVHWLIDCQLHELRPGQHSTQSLEWSFPDYIASVDALITKPGYGTFSEVARCGTPVLNIAREDWVESPYLEKWLESRVPLVTVSLEKVASGEVEADIAMLLSQPRGKPYLESGISDSVAILASLVSV